MTKAQLHSWEADDPYLLTPEESRRLLRNAPWSRFAVIGDTGVEDVTKPVEGDRPPCWPDQLVRELRGVRPDLAYLNLGKQSLLAAQIRARQLEPALQFKPDLAAVLAGGYDIFQTTFDIDAVETELARVVSALRRTGCTVLTIGLLNTTSAACVQEKHRKPLNERIVLLARRTQAVSARLGATYVDLPRDPGNTQAIYSANGLHLNRHGHTIIAREVIRRLGQQLGNDVASR
jgi:lysophospholipase L1-like esterase